MIESESASAVPEWREYSRDIPGRLLLPIHGFEYRLMYVPVLLQGPERLSLANVLRSAVVEALRRRPECQLHALNIWINPQEDIQPDPTSGTESAYVTVAFDNPVYGFTLQLGPTTFIIRKQREPLEHLVRAAPMFEEITRELFSREGREGQQGRLGPLLGAQIHRVNFSFETRVAMGKRLSDETAEPSNWEVIHKLIRLQSPAPLVGHEYPLAALQPGEILRGDLSFGFVKELCGRPRVLWISLEAPQNVTRKDVDTICTYRVGAPQAPLEVEDLSDFRTPLVEFYKELILRRFFADVFHDVQIAGRL